MPSAVTVSAARSSAVTVSGAAISLTYMAQASAASDVAMFAREEKCDLSWKVQVFCV